MAQGDFVWGHRDATGWPFSLTYPNGQVTSYSYLGRTLDQRLQHIKHQQTASRSVLSQLARVQPSRTRTSQAPSSHPRGHDGSAHPIEKAHSGERTYN
jgi:hypothetical protein